jgi:hypothetical protein
MGRRVITSSLLLFLLLLIASGAALADPINLQSASLAAGSANVLSLQGTGLNVQVAFTPPAFPQVNHRGLTTVSVEITPADAAGALTIGGVDYRGYQVAGAATFSVDLTHPTVSPTQFGVLDKRVFTGTLAVIDPQTGLTVATLDFEFTAKVYVSVAGDPCDGYYLTEVVTKAGRGKVTLTRDHAPVPEPATLLLLGSGLAAIGMRLRKMGSSVG